MTSAPPTAITVLTLIPIATFTLRFTRHSFRFLVAQLFELLGPYPPCAASDSP
jgi:hypothetical protein